MTIKASLEIEKGKSAIKVRQSDAKGTVIKYLHPNGLLLPEPAFYESVELAMRQWRKFQRENCG
jgi:hypothetical protein